MKVKLNVSISGTRDGEDWPERGSVVDLPAGEATAMIEAGMASPVSFPAPETASVEAPEVAARRGPGRPRKVSE